MCPREEIVPKHFSPPLLVSTYAIKSSNLIHIGEQFGINHNGAVLVKGDVKAQFTQAMKNVGAILK